MSVERLSSLDSVPENEASRLCPSDLRVLVLRSVSFRIISGFATGHGI
jgi:hypothetical protein